jgi:hypothetical protein
MTTEATVKEVLPPPPAERFFKIRNSRTGLFKTAGLNGTDCKSNVGWSKNGKVWSPVTLSGHLALFLRTNKKPLIWVHGKGYEIDPAAVLPRPDLEEGALFYGVPAEYQIVEYFSLGHIVPTETVMRKQLDKIAAVSQKRG